MILFLGFCLCNGVRLRRTSTLLFTDTPTRRPVKPNYCMVRVLYPFRCSFDLKCHLLSSVHPPSLLDTIFCAFDIPNRMPVRSVTLDINSCNYTKDCHEVLPHWFTHTHVWMRLARQQVGATHVAGDREQPPPNRSLAVRGVHYHY